MPSATLQPITIYGHWGAPNPWKVIILLKELGLPYTHRGLELSDVKKPPFINVNPNGRVPAIEDPNTGVKLWEVRAEVRPPKDCACANTSRAARSSIISVQHMTRPPRCRTKIPSRSSSSISGYSSRYRVRAVLHHTSHGLTHAGQGPYFGQWAHFLRFHPEKLPSAIERYAKETERVISVLDGVLAKSSSGWLVGDKCTYADLAFVTWAHVADGMFKQSGTADHLEKYPSYGKWLKAMGERDSVKACIAEIAKGRAEHGLPP